MTINASPQIPPRPIAIEPIFSNIPEELRLLPQWVLWRFTWRDEKWKKIPFQCNGRPAKSNDPQTWDRFDEVAHVFESYRGRVQSYSGVGFVFTAADPYVGVDVDKCRALPAGELSPLAREVRAALAGAYAEVSPSGTGLHFIVRGRLPFTGKKDDALGLEMYQEERYFCVTGHAIGDEP